MAAGRVVIRKYENRRLYDSSRSKYVNLEEIASLIRKGTEVQVVDAKTGEDLTRTTLMQIIAEDAKDKPAALPLELLRQLVVASDHVGKEFIMWYLKSAFDAYNKLQSTLTSGFSEVQAAAVSPVDAIKNFLRVPISGESSRTPATNAPDSEVEELRRRIAELESRLKKPTRRSTKSRKAKA